MGTLSTLAALCVAQTVHTLRPGAVISTSGHVAPGTYLRPGQDDQPALVIRGDNITVDFRGATIRGTPAETEPNERRGLGILVEGRHITIRNLRLRGYKVGVLAQNSHSFQLLDSDLSHNWREELKSTAEQEAPSDWLSFRQNENDEWLRHGAGVYLVRSNGFKLRNVRIQNGQCGVLIRQSHRGIISNSDFSFNSGIGVGLYRSEENVIKHNRIDWCVRGYSHGRWNLGQGSAGVLLQQQSHRNVIAYNSITHGGIGILLSAGQWTTEAGEGGSNDNLIYGNDVSHAPTNGIEATRSRNRFANNLIQECWHGLWGTQSSDSLILGNRFALNGSAIAIENGQDNTISFNSFLGDFEALALWERPPASGGSPLANLQGGGSRDYTVRENTFEHASGHALDLRGVNRVTFGQNVFRSNARILAEGSQAANVRFQGNAIRAVRDASLPDLRLLLGTELRTGANSVTLSPAFRTLPPRMLPSGLVVHEPTTRGYLSRFNQDWNPLRDRPRREVALHAARPLPGGVQPFLRPGSLRGRRYILMDRWGPYDFRRPTLWLRQSTVVGDQRTLRFEVLGPQGRWRLAQSRGVRAARASGSVPGFLEATAPLSANDLRLDLEYRGGATTDYRGIITPAGVLVAFSWAQFVPNFDWRVSWWSYDADSEDPRKEPDKFERLAEASAHSILRLQDLHFSWPGEPVRGVSADHFGTRATSAIRLSTGVYRLSVTADDGVRVWVDDELVLDQWEPTSEQTHTRELRLGGMHQFRVDHFELNGFAQLRVRLERL